MADEFSDWLSAELKQRGWSQRELARRAGLPQSGVSKSLSGERRPTADICVKIAQALGESPEKLLRLAGILPDLPADENDPLLKEINDLAKRMDRQQRHELLRFAEFMFRKGRKGKKG